MTYQHSFPVRIAYGLNVGLFGLFVYGATLQSDVLKTVAAIAGTTNGVYLAAKVPNRKQQLALEAQERLQLRGEVARLQAELGTYQDKDSWNQRLLESQSEQFQQQYAQLERDYQEKLAALETEREEMRSHFQARLDSAAAKYTQALQESRQESEHAAVAFQSQLEQALAAKDEQIAQLKQQAVLELAQLQSRIHDLEAERDAVRQRAQELNQIEAQLKSTSDEIRRRNEWLKVEEARYKVEMSEKKHELGKALEDAKTEIQALQLINQRLTLESAELKAQNAQLFDELYGSKSELKDELVTQIQSCLAQNQIPTEFLSKEVRGGVDFIYLKPTNYFEPSRLKVVADLLPGFVDIPKPEIDAKNGRVEVKVDRRSAIDKIKDVSPNWLARLYQDASVDGKNFAILGARGGGKTELAKNLCGLIINNEPACEVVYIQPKIDDFAVFEVGGKQFEPGYIGFEPITGSAGNRIPSAYEGIFYLKELYNRRNTQNQQAFADGQPSPKFNRVFFLIDELQLLVSREKEFIDPDIIKEEGLRNGQTFCGKIVRDAISIGRSLGIVVLALGQIPNVSVYGWQKQDLYQFIVLFMAASIPEAIKSAAPTKQEEKRISDDLELWRKRSDIDSTKRFYCYVRPMDKSGYLALLPEPGKYLKPSNLLSNSTNDVEPLPLKSSGDFVESECRIASNPASNVESLPLKGFSDSAEFDRRMVSNPQNIPFLATGNGVESAESVELLKRIEQIKASGEVRLKNIIALAFKEKYPKCDDQKSRDYKKAREEYRQLTGE